MKYSNAVILRLDRGIQIDCMFLDCPVKPDNDDFLVFSCRSNNKKIWR